MAREDVRRKRLADPLGEGPFREFENPLQLGKQRSEANHGAR
jgi:hypothetical protein